MDLSDWAFVSLGSNLGDSMALLNQALDRLRAFSAEPIRVSAFWKTAPLNCPPGSPDFINAAAGISPLPEETPESLFSKLRQLEAELGRQPKRVSNEPRPLDLDLIAFGRNTRQSAQLTLPHPRAHLRRFVLCPLAEIAPDLVLPGQRETVAALARSLDDPSQRAVKIVELPRN